MGQEKGDKTIKLSKLYVLRNGHWLWEKNEQRQGDWMFQCQKCDWVGSVEQMISETCWKKFYSKNEKNVHCKVNKIISQRLNHISGMQGGNKA